jgi:hypothetical protein
MTFRETLTEATQETITCLNSIMKYFNEGEFKSLYPKENKYIDHVRQENYLYKGKKGNIYSVMVVLKQKIVDDDKDKLVDIIKNLTIIKDNKAKIERNGLMVKIKIAEKSAPEKSTENSGQEKV